MTDRARCAEPGRAAQGVVGIDARDAMRVVTGTAAALAHQEGRTIRGFAYKDTTRRG